MIWQIIEIIAVLAESFLAVRFNYGYFQLKNEKNKVLKLSAGTLVLSLWDYFWTVYAKSEIWSMAGFAAILFLFSILFLKNSAFEKFIIAVISCTLFYFINLPVLYIFSHIFNRTVLEMTLSQGPERVFILFLTKMLYFAVTQMFVYFRQKQAFLFKKNEWVLITTEFTITLLISFLLYSLSVSTWNKLYTYTIIVLMLTFLDTIAFTFMKKINAKNTEETEIKEAVEPKEIKDIKEVSQGKVVIGLDIAYNKKDSRYQMALYNVILGESATSKLFQNVREKASLAYSARSNYIRQKNNIYIRCGIEIEKYEEALKIIKEQLEDMKNGNFSEEDLNNAKKYMLAGIRTVQDEQDSEVTYYFGQEISGTFTTFDEYMNKINGVSRDEIIEVANSIKINTIYFLRN